MDDHPPALRAEIAALKTELLRLREALANAQKTIEAQSAQLRHEQAQKKRMR
ncbi:hypothetical protein IFJ82_13710 [Novacetimonas hansenii]|uniref:Transposase n=2 Tax=Novacetimonas hansenii TaxID=436 RepID=A0AAW5EQA1_NOVHA|nr:hypothetical protein [Novacetimonas hansenii]EFG85452.1 hypothetical protein GXY_03443 [Novacetimonas hansenii ATCC 23769]MBL7237813.1 hypothetical protein [Novacetimonas hansenii]MCJ8353789.1 hypothetical protein [Novacetimonas hansenii]QOF94892.1 hypothetical protein IFJ82_13710 [Novacetimonas hansenii]WEQ57735.1 hypothetical protein LV563_07315 [Novacetimonas hansenii]